MDARAAIKGEKTVGLSDFLLVDIKPGSLAAVGMTGGYDL
jgi:hypothetical protein